MADPGLTVGGGLSIPRALARAKFYVLRPLLDRLRMTYVLPVRPTRKLASLAIIIIITIIVGCKHRASEVLLYIGGRGLVSQIIEPVTFVRCAFIIALRNIALDGYLDTRRNI